jgi:beta-glucosidase
MRMRNGSAERHDEFPRGFLWGSATSSHQVEGGNVGNDWWQWETIPGHIRDGTRSGDAAGWWRGMAERDLSLAASLGQNAHRFSLEWSRIEPSPGRYDASALDRYAEIFAHAASVGLARMVTLHHFTLPRWAADAGGWLNRALPERFGRFAEHVAERLGDRVDLWATINEPSVLAVMAYGGTRWPPGRGALGDAFRAQAVLLDAHARAAAALRARTPAIPVGIVLNMPRIEPARPHHPLDRAIAWIQDWVFSGAVLRALDTGRLVPPLTKLGRRVDGLARSFDWLGLNYYGRLATRFDPRDRNLARHVQQPTVRSEWIDWGEPCARGMRDQLLRLAHFGVPLYVTENGVYDNDDNVRPGFLVDHVRAVSDAIAAGADVRGYFHWSLVDNFEWTEGWSTRFGLIEVDPASGRRNPRASAEVYAEICRTGRVPDARR